MLITLSSPACRKAAALLESVSSKAPSPQLMSLAAKCLKEIAEFGPNYINNINVCLPFLTELKRHIHELCGGNQKQLSALHDLAFELVECFALIARENALAKVTQHKLPAQVEVMDFFENSGEWAHNDGTLVSDYYYRLIPERVQSAA